MDPYDVALAIAGIAIFGAAVVPRILAGRPLSFPIVYVALGFVVFTLPLGLESPDPLAHGEMAERLTELVVIVSLMGAGLKLDRPFGLRTWRTTWRLLAVTMPLTIVGAALLGWWMVGLAPAAAMLLGAVLAPTDPVLASDVQVGGPGRAAGEGDDEGDDEEDDVRFALTSEAGLNDGLAFPFTNAAIAAAVASSPSEWVGGWLLEDVVVKIVVGLVVGFLIGRLLARVFFRLPVGGRLAESAEGFLSLAATLLTYGLAELAHGYGFLAVFVAACSLRSFERDHDYHEILHDFAEATERLLSAALLVLVGGAVAGGILGPITWKGVAVAVVIVLVLRPLVGMIGLAGVPCPWHERLAIAFFGIRGIGSAYYLAHALNETSFEGADALWALVTLVVLLSVVMHGVSASPIMVRLDARRQATGSEAAAR